jgi:membrane dipeptidase
MQRAGVRVVGMTVATAWPNVRGTLSGWHFRSLGIPSRALASRMATAEWLIGRIHGWADESEGQMLVIRSNSDLRACLVDGGPIGVLIGVQGGHALDGSLANVERLHALGVRMFAPAHVMDNALVGSGTGRRGDGLTGLGRDVVRELEARRIIVDVAHMSLPGIADVLGMATRPVVLSHTGLTDVAGSSSRWRRYSAATRNVPRSVAAGVAASGGLVGITLATQLVGGDTLDDVVRTVRAALDAAGERGVGIGSDLDGALRMVSDVSGLPSLAEALSASGLPAAVVDGVMGGNAIRLLREML